MIFPVFTSPEFMSTALHQTLVLKNIKAVSYLNTILKYFILHTHHLLSTMAAPYHVLPLSQDSEK